jgi:hypothetical protein
MKPESNASRLRSDSMENVWMTIAEIAVEPGDMASGNTIGFVRITMWASSHEEFAQKLEVYLAEYKWKLLSMEQTTVVDQSKDYGDEVNQMIEETAGDHNAIRLGTFHGYRPN